MSNLVDMNSAPIAYTFGGVIVPLQPAEASDGLFSTIDSGDERNSTSVLSGGLVWAGNHCSLSTLYPSTWPHGFHKVIQQVALAVSWNANT